MRFSTVSMNAGATTIAAVAAAIATSPVGSAEPASSMSGDGWFISGKDILPGTYQTSGPVIQKGKCSWVMHKYIGYEDVRYEDVRIMANTAQAGPMFAQVPPAVDAVAFALETHGCNRWVLVS
jgi:hypothetical protein